VTAAGTRRDLRRLARLRGIQLSYTGHDGRAVHATAETLAGVLEALGYPVPNAAAIRDQLRLAESETAAGPRDGRSTDQWPVPRRLDPPARGLGVNAPLYALRSRDDWGVGSFRDLAGFAELAASWGADLIGTLPLFAISTESPIDPSPYLPISRLFWNELYVDVGHAAALAGCDSPAELRPTPRVRAADAVDYDTVAAAKRSALEVCAAAMQQAEGRRRTDFERFVAEHPELDGFAEFRAKGNERDAQYHRFVQYAASVQLAEAASRGEQNGVGLYLDLPVGVHPDGYDTWAYPDLFADAQVGAPPDSFFAGGQAWGFPPLHPQRLQASGYRYFIDGLRVALRHSRAVRIDHVLGLQRLYWIPPGADATSGAYVHYPFEELLAIITAEADRAGAVVIGEDLGTVSPQIRRAMDRAGVLHSFVYQFDADATTPFPQPRRPSAASLGTHDLPRFAAFWRDPGQRDLVAAVGEPDPARAVATCLEELAGGSASYLLVDVADLEGEVEPDNRPGTGPEAGNWRHRLPRPIEELATDDELRRLMTGLAERRTRAHAHGKVSP
jgi:4-alpha-glucanotransferase